MQDVRYLLDQLKTSGINNYVGTPANVNDIYESEKAMKSNR